MEKDETLCPESYGTKGDGIPAKSDRVGPGEDMLDSEVPVEMVQKNATKGGKRRGFALRTAEDPSGKMEEIARAALDMKSHMEEEIVCLAASLPEPRPPPPRGVSADARRRSRLS